MSFADLLRSEYEKRFVRHELKLDYQEPSIPLDISVHGEGQGLEVPYEELELLLFCSRWQEILPEFLDEGRSAVAQRKEPLVIGNNIIHQYRLKGVGNRKGNVVTPPQTELFNTLHQKLPHILVHTGIADDGSFIPILDPTKPLGGLSSGRGRREFENASLLLEHGVPAVLPVRWGIYNGITFNDGKNEGNLEFVMLGIPVKTMHRVVEFFEPGGARFNPKLLALIDRKFDFYHPGKIPALALRTICDITQAFGESMCAFHTAGLTRFAGHSGNYTYDEERRVAVLHDLDSSVKQSDCHPNTVGLSRIRDVESCLFGLFHSYQHSEMYSYVDSSTRRKHNPFKTLLRGYFGESADSFSEEVLTFFEREMDKHPFRSAPEYYAWFSEMGARLQAFIIRGLIPVYNQTQAAREHVLPYGQDEFDRQFAAYTVKRNEMLRRVNFNASLAGHPFL